MTFFPPIFRLYPTDIHTVLHWTLDESVEPLASSGTNTTLSLTTGFNDGYVREGREGLFSKACDFTPPTTLTSGDTSVEPPGNSFTISCWAFCRSFPNPSSFVGKTFHLTGTGWNSPFWSISMQPDTSGLFVTNYAIGGVEATLTGPATDPIPTNQWTFLAITFDGVNINQYINGNLINQSSAINDTIDWGDGGPWCVGGNDLQQTGGHDGLIDDVRVENIVRTASYLQTQYKNGIGFYELPATSEFTPDQVGGLVLWLRTDKGVITDGYSIAKTKDQSGFTSDGIQATTSDRPLLVRYLGQNNHPSMGFDANQKFLTGVLTAPSVPLSDLTFFLVAKFNSDSDRAAIALTDNSFTVDSGLELSMQSPTTFRIERFASGGNQTTDLASDTTSTKIYSGTGDATALQGYINGIASGTPAGSTTGLNPIYGHVTGAADDTGSSNMDGYIYECMLYDRVLGGGERLSINSYLLKKYAIPNSPPPFDPTQIAGCALWLRGDLGITQSGGNISVWADQSGNGRDATQTFANNKPTFASSGINGLASIVCDHSVAVQFLGLSAGVLSSLTAAEFFVVAQNDDDGVSFSEPCCFTDSVGANFIPFVDRKIYDNFGSTARHDTGFAPAAGVWSSPWLYNVSAITNEWIARLNGSVVFSDATNTVGSFTYCNIGSDPGNSVGMQGKIAEIIVYDHKLNTTDRAAVSAYLTTRYGL